MRSIGWPDVTYYRCMTCGQILDSPFPHPRFIGSSTLPQRCARGPYLTIPGVPS